MKASILPKRICLIVILLVALYCTIVVYIDVTFAYAQFTWAFGEEQPLPIDFSQLPRLVIWLTRLSSFGLSFLGILSAFDARRIKYLRLPLMVYLTTWAWSIYLLIGPTTSPKEILTSSPIFSNFAPGVLGILGLFFLAAREDLWQELKEYMAKFFILQGCLVFVLSAFVQAGSRFSGRRYVGALGAVLQICAVVPIYLKPRGVPRFLHFVPVAAVIFCGILTQTRLTFVLLTVQLLSVALLQRKRLLARIIRPRLSSGQVIALFFASGVIVVAVWTFTFGPLHASTQAFGNRMGDDTRSGQLINFFQRIPVSSLLLGHGYPTGSDYTSQGIDGIDLGYVNIAYVGGIPAAFLVFYFLVLPGIRLIGARSVELSLQIAPICLTTGVAFLSSNIFDISPGYVMFMVLCGGRAYTLAHGQSSRALVRSRAPVLRHEYVR